MATCDDPYDLVTNPWIPVVDRAGFPARVGLAELFEHAGSLRAFAGPPPVRTALLRLATALVRDALGRAQITDDRWDVWWRSGALPVDVVDRYLADYADRLTLFDPSNPFLQDASLNGEAAAIVPAAKLASCLRAGDGSGVPRQLTDTEPGSPARITAADAACWLVAEHAHSFTDAAEGRHSGAAARISYGSGLLHGRLLAVPECDDIARTVLLNLPRAAREPGDVPSYLASRPVRPGAQACGPVSLLTWTACRVLLVRGRGGLVDAVKLAADKHADPSVPRQVQADHDPHLLAACSGAADGEWTLAAAAAERTPLRDAAVLARYLAAPAIGSALPAATSAALHVPVRLAVYGSHVDSATGCRDWTDSSLPWNAHDFVLAAAIAAQAAANVAGAAAAVLAETTDGPAGSDPRFAATLRERAYAGVWRRLDAPGRELLDRIAGRPAGQVDLAEWRRHCVTATYTALADTAARCAISRTPADGVPPNSGSGYDEP